MQEGIPKDPMAQGVFPLSPLQFPDLFPDKYLKMDCVHLVACAELGRDLHSGLHESTHLRDTG
jgi:hypothetical protein